MKEVVAIRHIAFEHLGTLASVLDEIGYHTRYLDAGMVDFAALDPLAPELLVVLGGPIGAYEENQYPFLTDELRLIEHRLKAERPILGVCLGAQLMTRSLGSRVYPGSAKEIGWSSIHLTDEGRNSCLAGLSANRSQVLHWHGDTFDLPEGSRRLAYTDVTENQAFCKGEHALGLQFHLEIDPLEIERWLIGHAHEIAATADVDAEVIRADTQRFGSGLASAAADCFQRWLAGAGL